MTHSTYRPRKQLQIGCTILISLAVSRHELPEARAALTTVVLSGQSVPGGNAKFGSPGTASLNDHGQVTFVDAHLTGTAAASDTGIFRAGSGGFKQLAREGQTVPGGGTFASPFDYAPLNNAGNAVAALHISGAASNEGIYRLKAGVIEPVVREGDSAPGGGVFKANVGNTFTSAFTDPTINSYGHTAFIAGVSGTGANNVGIFRAQPADLIFPAEIVQIARLGDQAPEGNGVFAGFQDLSLGAGSRSSGGYVAFSADLTIPGQSVRQRGIFRGTEGSVFEIARQGQDAGGLGTFGNVLQDPAMNDLGQVAFIGSLAGARGTQQRGIFRGNEYSMAAIALQGDAVPDGNGDFGSLNFAPAINTAGQVAFVAPLVGSSGGNSDNSGVYLGNGNALFTIAREGQTAPAGGQFAGFGELALNIAGNLAFAATLRSPGKADSTGLFYYGATGGLRQIAREGDSLEGSVIAGDLTFAGSTGSSGIWRSGMNNNNQLAFPFELADGRYGVALWTPETILPPLIGDYNNNRRIEQGDLDLVLLNWGKVGNPAPTNWRSDLPVGRIDQGELDKVLLNWGGFIRAGMAVPEPSGVGLAAVGVVSALVLILRGRSPVRATADRGQL